MISVHDVQAQGEHKLFRSYLDQTTELSPARDISPDQFMAEPGWIFFEPDFARQWAVFLNIGAEHKIFDAPFVHLAAPRHARKVAVMDFECFVTLSNKIPVRHKLVHVFNMGHCGSTLLHNVVNETGQAWDVSEPKLSFAIAMGRDELPRTQLVDIAAASARFLSLYPRAREREVLFLKHHSQCSQVFDIWHEATPDAKNLYMYRDAVGWCNSLYGFVQRMGFPLPMSREVRNLSWMMTTGGEPESLARQLMDFDGEPFAAGDMFACGWGLHLQKLQAARSAGMEFLAFRYNELLQDRETVLKSVFQYCGLDPAKVALGLKAFDHDSHAGEKTSHDKSVEKMSEISKSRIYDILRQPRLDIDANVIV
jgi:hypothetical protein